jgi:hypothetical protein
MSFKRLHVRRGESVPDPAVVVALAKRTKGECWVPKQWLQLGHDQQHLQSLDSCEIPEAKEKANLIANVYRGTISDSFYWNLPRPQPWSFFSDWLSHRSPYVLKPKFTNLRRRDLIVEVLVCRCYRRLRTELSMANINLTGMDVPAYMIGCKKQVRHVLNTTDAMFRNRRTLNDSTYEKTSDSAKRVIQMLIADADAR